MTAPAAATPCIGVCRMDPGSGWCEGCLRTLDEIAAWSALGEADRRLVWRAIGARRIAWQRRGGAVDVAPPELP